VLATGVTIAVAFALAGAFVAITRDVIIGVAVGAGFYAVAFRFVKARQHAPR